jgi:outer membrane protein OmpA-like peptidoglycan-associated protein
VSKGYGESKPIADNTNADGSDNPDGRQKNRRTEFKILK